MNSQKELNAKYIEILRSMSGERRLQIAFELFEMAVHLTEAGIRSQHPTYTEEEVAAELRKRISGETARALTPRH